MLNPYSNRKMDAVCSSRKHRTLTCVSGTMCSVGALVAIFALLELVNRILQITCFNIDDGESREQSDPGSSTSTRFRATHFLAVDNFEMNQVLQGGQAKISADSKRVFLTVEQSPSSQRGGVMKSTIFLFEKSYLGTWHNRGALLACDEDLPLLSFDVSGNGKTIIARCYTNSGNDYGPSARAEVLILENSGGSTWSSKRIVSLSNFCANRPTFSFSISFDGKTVILNSIESGANYQRCPRRTRVFARHLSGTWNRQFENVDDNPKISSLVALSGDGATFAQIANNWESGRNTPAIILFRLSQTSQSWIALPPLFLDPALFGISNNRITAILLSHKGDVLLLSVIPQWNHEGRGIVCTYDENKWRRCSVLEVKDNSPRYNIGRAITMSSTGKLILICGQVGEDGESHGVCWLFSGDIGGKHKWMQEGEYTSKLISPCPRCNNYGFGDSVQITPDASTFIVGGFTQDFNGGGVEVFERTEIALSSSQG